MKKRFIVVLAILFIAQMGFCEKDLKAETKDETSLNISYLHTLLDGVYGYLKGERRDALVNNESPSSFLLPFSKAIRAGIKHINEDVNLIKRAFEIVEFYEKGGENALFINEATQGGLLRTDTKDKEIHFALIEIQQGLIDYAYTSKNLEAHPEIFANKKFECSKYFPAECPPATDPNKVHKVKIKAQNRESWGSPFAYEKADARRPTGFYAPAGSIVKINVPENMINKGYKIRLGSHSWDNAKKPKIQRLDRISIVYPIDNTQMLVANPMGGGIYIEVPYLADLGVIEIEIINAVKSPYFSAKSFDKMTLEEWKEVRNSPAPWADFESDKIMLNMPTKWIYNFDDPISLMQKWDKLMDSVIELRGWEGYNRDKTILYLQADLQFRGGAYYPGYPQTNDVYKPSMPENGNKNHYYLNPEIAYSACFHELGHAVFITKFRGEVEAIVNFLYVAIANQNFGLDLDTAFIKSFKAGHNFKGIDEVAQMWLVKDNFRAGKEMNYTNVAGDEMKYQYTGYAKYVDYVDLFGWQAINSFFRAYELDYMNNKEFFPKIVNKDDTDSRIFNLSKSANCDVRPLIHFWGIQPEKPEALAEKIAKANLKPSPAIYDKLLHYKNIIPTNNEEFKALAQKVYPKGIKEDEKTIKNGMGWYYNHLNKYSETHAQESRKALQNIIDTYFPKGRP
ncbi:MAG: M60 family peptidase N-terminal accessory domain-containing protein [Opitutales bacterium]